jgi:hypothetical protein
MAQGPALLDLLIGLLQSMVVLLLASGVYVALAVRKGQDSPVSAEGKPSASPSGHRGPRAVTPGA